MRLALLLPAVAGVWLLGLPAVADEPAKHWAFVPPTEPRVPSTPYPVLSPIDAFVRAESAKRKIEPAPPADRRTLVRRVTFDLTGLPPTPAEVEAFVTDSSKDAFPKVVERLLASPAYGEKWGRHWLDVVRYADSNGLDENIAHGNAWRYRDYVIRSFNADKPYDRFLQEQIAGDLLPGRSDTDRLIATGFLTLGPKVLAEADKRKLELDIVDEQLDTLGRTVMALTIGCARCHDHKFDPVSITDYYALAGVFLSTKTMESLKTIARWHENPVGTPAEIQRQRIVDRQIATLTAKVAALKTDDAISAADRAGAEAELAAVQKAAPDPVSAMGVADGMPTDAPLLRRGNHLRPGDVVPRGVPVVLAGNRPPDLTGKSSGRLELAQWLTRPDHSLTARVMANRVWRWHFGRGLVASVDNFGLLGDRPTHPELLDYLAKRFVESGWSVKALHRLIVLSATYQMSSTHAANADPDNTLLWRFSPRRLEAEELRDAVLAVSGRLDPTLGGPALSHVKNREFLFDHTSKDLTKYDSLRRSVYLPVIRNNLYDVFQLFDATDAAVGSGNRATTTVATQSLFWLNSELVTTSADVLAAKLVAATADPAARVDRLYRTAYGRPATAAEVAKLTAAVGRFGGSEREAWAKVCHVILAANEFVTVR